MAVFCVGCRAFAERADRLLRDWAEIELSYLSEEERRNAVCERLTSFHDWFYGTHSQQQLSKPCDALIKSWEPKIDREERPPVRRLFTL